MTDRIAEITARCEAATPGPWEWRYNSRNDYGVEAESLKGVITLEDIYPGYPECGEHLIMDIGTPDADFIAQAREDIPFLLSRLAERNREVRSAELSKRKYQEVIAGLEAEIERLQEAQKRLEEAFEVEGICAFCRHFGTSEDVSPCWECVAETARTLPSPPEETP